MLLNGTKFLSEGFLLVQMEILIMLQNTLIYYQHITSIKHIDLHYIGIEQPLLSQRYPGSTKEQ